MSSTDALIKITQADIDRVRQEIEEHEAKAKEGREWLRAAEFLMGQQNGVVLKGLGAHITDVQAAKGANGQGQPGKDLTRAIEQIATESTQPLAKTKLKQMLREQDFAESRLQNYFYTAIMRLKNKGRIRVLDDGRVWGPPS